jgi:DnaA family protein
VALNPHQFTLDLLALPTPTLENFVAGPNGAALAALHDVLAGRGPAFVHLWGPPGSGRSHLLAAVDRAASRGTAGNGAANAAAIAVANTAPDTAANATTPTQGLLPGLASAVPAFRPSRQIYVADDVQALDPPGLARLFGLQNQIRQNPGCFLVTAADLPPARLDLREDVRTRLGWGLVFALQPITEPDQAAALAAYARSRGARVEDDLVPYMLTRLPRDMRTLVSVLNSLDAFGLARQRALTVPLLREWLQQEPQAAFAEVGQTSPVARQMNLPIKLPLLRPVQPLPGEGPGAIAVASPDPHTEPSAEVPGGSMPSGQ